MEIKMKFDGIILDIDGTIWNTTEVVAQAWNQTFEKYFPQITPVTPDILKGQFGKTMDIIADNLFGDLNPKDRKFLLEQCCFAEQKALVSNKNDITYPGVIETLHQLYYRIPLFIVSNCQKGYIELVMQKNNITKLIKDYECFGNTGLPKDKNICSIIKRNKLKNPIYVGDTQGDSDACKKAGIPFIYAAYGFGSVNDKDCYAKINLFSELIKIIE